MTKSLLETPQCKNVFGIEREFFQNAPWNFLEESLNINSEYIVQSCIGVWRRRQIENILNKTYNPISRVNDVDLVLIDMFACVSNVLYEVNKKIIVSANYQTDLFNLNSVLKEKGMPLEIREIYYADISWDFLNDAIEKFAEWLQKVYAGKQIVVQKIKFAKKYLNSQMQIMDLPREKLIIVEEKQKYIDLIENLLIEKVDNCIVYDFPEDMLSSNWGNNTKKMSIVHYTTTDYLRLGYGLLEILGIDYRDYYMLEVDPDRYVLESWIKKAYEIKEEWKVLQEERTGKLIIDDSQDYTMTKVLELNHIEKWKRDCE